MTETVATSIPRPLARLMMIGGLLAGAGIAAWGLHSPRVAPLPDHAIARVNQRLILRDTWLRAVAAVASERRSPLTAEDQRHILDRLIDEELLVQHGLALGLVEQDRRLRGQVVSDVLMSARMAAAEPADEATLQHFYEENREFFAQPSRLRIAAWQLTPDGQQQAFTPPVPDVLLPIAKLRQYLGPQPTAELLRIPETQSSLSVAHGAGSLHIDILERESGQTPAFSQVQEQVRAERQRRIDEAAVKQLLSNLRDGGQVVIGKLPP